MFRLDMYDVGYDFSSLSMAFEYDITKTPEENRADFMKAFDVPRLSDSQIRKIGSAGMNQFSLSAAKRSPEDRLRALRINKLAQGCLATEILGIQAAVARLEKEMGQTNALARDLAYLRRDETDEALQFNKELLAACRSGDPKEIGRLQYRIIKYAQEQLGITSKEDIYKLTRLNDDELMEKHHLISLYGRVLHDSDRILENNEFTPEQEQEIRDFKAVMQSTMLAIHEKLNIMANPIYADLDPAYFYGKSSDFLSMGAIASELKEDGRYPDTRKDDPLSNFAGKINDYCISTGVYAVEYLTALNPELVGATLSKNANGALSSGLPAVARTKTGQDMVLINGMPTKVQTADAYTKELQELAIKADRFLLTGSKEFDNMLREVKELNAARERNADEAEMAKRTADLAVAAKKYLEHKDLDAPYDAKAILNRGSKNQREQSRMEVASFLYHYASGQQSVRQKEQENAIQEKKDAEAAELQEELDELEQLNTSKMSEEQFRNHLESLSELGTKHLTAEAMTKADFKPKDYYKVLSQELEAQVANKLLDPIRELEKSLERETVLNPQKGIKTNEDKVREDTQKLEEAKKFLDSQKRVYTSLVAGLRKFVREKSDRELIDNYCKVLKPLSMEGLKLTQATDQMRNSGVEEDLKGVMAKNGELKQNTDQVQHNPNQLQQSPDQLQMQQPPQPQQAGPQAGP